MFLKYNVIILFFSLIAAKGAAAVEPLVIAKPQQMQAVCWYEGREYSKGARIEMVGQVVQCGSKDPFMPDGPVLWLPLDERGAPIYPEPPRPKNKITINKP